MKLTKDMMKLAYKKLIGKEHDNVISKAFIHDKILPPSTMVIKYTVA